MLYVVFMSHIDLNSHEKKDVMSYGDISRFYKNLKKNSKIMLCTIQVSFKTTCSSLAKKWLNISKFLVSISILILVSDATFV